MKKKIMAVLAAIAAVWGHCVACRRGHRPVRRPQEHHSSPT